MNPKVSDFIAKTETVVAGDTSTPSQIKIKLFEQEIGGRTKKKKNKALRVRLVNDGTVANSTNAVLAAGADATVVTTHTSNKDITFTEAAVANATGTLTISGVAIEGETVTLGSRVYEFTAGGSVTGSNVEVDIEADTTKAQGTLTIAEPVTAGDVIQIGDKTYVFVANGTGNTDGEIDLGADEAATKVNIVAAINGTDGYNTANADVTAAAFASDDCVLTAIVGGTAGNSIVTAEVGQGLTHASNVFDATTLGTTTAGVDCTASDAVTALVAAITGDASAVVTAADGTGDTVDVTAIVDGTDGNSIASTETMANGAFGAATLSGAADADGTFTVTVTNGTAETIDLLVVPAAEDSVALKEHLRVGITHAAP